MGVILWEDSIQRELKQCRHYTGATVQPPVKRHETLLNTRAEGEAHTRYATRRSRYFAHTKTGKRYATRPVVHVKASDPWGLRLKEEVAP